MRFLLNKISGGSDFPSEGNDSPSPANQQRVGKPFKRRRILPASHAAPTRHRVH